MRHVAGRSATDRGASSVEYGLLIALIAAVIFAAVVAFGSEVDGLFTDANSSLAPIDH